MQGSGRGRRGDNQGAAVELGVKPGLWHPQPTAAVNWLGDPDTAPLAIMVVSAWSFGLPMVVFIAGLQNIPPVLYEAARPDHRASVSPWRTKLRRANTASSKSSSHDSSRICRQASRQCKLRGGTAYPKPVEESSLMKIDRVRALHIRGQWDYHEPLGEASMTRPIHIYPECRAASRAGRLPICPPGRPIR